MKLGELSSYISGLFGMEKGEICYRDNENKELISPSIGIVNMIIMNPRKFKNIVIGNKRGNMKYLEKLNTNIDNFNVISSTSMNQISQIKNEIEKPLTHNHQKSLYQYERKDKSDALNNPSFFPRNTPSSNYSKYKAPKNPIQRGQINQTEVFSTMQSGEFEQNTINEPYSPPHYPKDNTDRHRKTYTPNRRNPYMIQTTNPNQRDNSKKEMIVTSKEPINQKQESQTIPVDIRYKSEKRIYREQNRRAKDQFEIGSEYNNTSTNNLIISNDNSIGEEELKFKPSYPAKKYSSGQFRTLNNYGEGEGNEKKENIRNNKQFIHKSRVFNEDFSENE